MVKRSILRTDLRSENELRKEVGHRYASRIKRYLTFLLITLAPRYQLHKPIILTRVVQSSKTIFINQHNIPEMQCCIAYTYIIIHNSIIEAQQSRNLLTLILAATLLNTPPCPVLCPRPLPLLTRPLTPLSMDMLPGFDRSHCPSQGSS